MRIGGWSRALGSCLVGLAAAACAASHEPLDDAAAHDALGERDAPTVDAGAILDARVARDAEDPLDAPDAARRDAPPIPLDAPWVAADAPRGDVPFVPSDAGPCASGDYALEGTPIPFEPVTLGYPSTTGWRDVWRDPETGAWEVHVIPDDLESVTTLGPLVEVPMVAGGFTYEAMPTDGVDPVGQARLVGFCPVASFIDHVLVAVYGLDGARRTEPVRLEATSCDVRAAWTGLGYSVLLLGAGFESDPRVRVELDASGSVRSRTSVGMLTAGVGGPSIGAYAYHGDAWYGLMRGWAGFLGLLAVRPDGSVTEGPTPGGGWTLEGGAFSEPGERYWVLVTGFAVPSPPALMAVDLRSVSSPAVRLFPTVVASARTNAIAGEDAETAGVLVSTGGEHWFMRVRGASVVQRLRLPDAPQGTAFLRYLEGRYAIGWGGAFLDELVRCP